MERTQVLDSARSGMNPVSASCSCVVLGKLLSLRDSLSSDMKYYTLNKVAVKIRSNVLKVLSTGLGRQTVNKCHSE